MSLGSTGTSICDRLDSIAWRGCDPVCHGGCAWRHFFRPFPIAIIDEDYEGKDAAGRGMRQLAAAIEKEGFRVVAGVSYEDARRLVEVFNVESCWLVSVDGAEATPQQWKILEEVLAAKRRRNDRCRSSCSATSAPRRWCRPAC